jgi:hypothetical protein
MLLPGALTRLLTGRLDLPGVLRYTGFTPKGRREGLSGFQQFFSSFSSGRRTAKEAPTNLKILRFYPLTTAYISRRRFLPPMNLLRKFYLRFAYGVSISGAVLFQCRAGSASIVFSLESRKAHGACLPILLFQDGWQPNLPTVHTCKNPAIYDNRVAQCSHHGSRHVPLRLQRILAVRASLSTVEAVGVIIEISISNVRPPKTQM